ncbi:hypothetical protein GCM10022245_54320 [Streptomyces mayteni]
MALGGAGASDGWDMAWLQGLQGRRADGRREAVRVALPICHLHLRGSPDARDRAAACTVGGARPRRERARFSDSPSARGIRGLRDSREDLLLRRPGTPGTLPRAVERPVCGCSRLSDIIARTAAGGPATVGAGPTGGPGSRYGATRRSEWMVG